MRLYGIIGNRLEKSLSPKLFNSLFKKSGEEARYLPFEVDRKHLKNLVVCMKLVDVDGLNVTQPYKKAVLPFLDRLDRSAKQAGAVNCIVRRKNRFIGYNTDGPGWVKAFREKCVVPRRSATLKGKRVTLIGAGGAAAGIGAACRGAGAQVTVLNRSGRHQKLRQNTFLKIFPKTDVLIHAVPVDLDLPLELLPKTAVVSDIRYNPHVTKLIRRAKKRKLKTLDGLWLFVYQGAENFGLWTGKRVSPDRLRALLLK